MVGFDTPVPGNKIFAVMKDKREILVSTQKYEDINHLGWHSIITLENDKGQIVFEGRRSEIERFNHVYPREQKADMLLINSHIYQEEKKKRDAFWKGYQSEMTQDQKDEVWSIIYARWGKSYDKNVDIGHGLSWRSFFRGMFPIIALEICGHTDKLSSNDGIIQSWIPLMEMPDLYGDIDKFRKFVKDAKQIQVPEVQQTSEAHQA